MLIDEQSDCLKGSAHAVANVPLESLEFDMFTQPTNNAEVPLIVSLPTLADDLVPLLQSPHILAELVILGPFLHDLKCIKSLRDALDQAGRDVLLTRTDLQYLASCIGGSPVGQDRVILVLKGRACLCNYEPLQVKEKERLLNLIILCFFFTKCKYNVLDI